MTGWKWRDSLVLVVTVRDSSRDMSIMYVLQGLAVGKGRKVLERRYAIATNSDQ